MKFRAAIAVLALTALTLAVAGSAPARSHDRATSVTRWIDVQLAEIASHRTNPPRAARGLALVSVAMQDASNLLDAIGGQRSPAQRRPFSPTSIPTARRRSTISPPVSVRGRPRWGRRLGERVVAYARTDGSDAVFQGTVPVGPGLWVPTPPAFAPPLEPLAGTWRTWNISSGSRFRPGPPPAFGSRRYAREVREVYDVARASHRRAEADRGLLGRRRRHGDAARALEPDRPRPDPPHRLSDRAAADLLAALNTAQADAFIACWDAKFTYWSERPVTAIRREFDPTWPAVHHDAAVPVLRFGPLDHLRRGVDRSRRALPRARRGSFAPGRTKPRSLASTAASTSAATTRPGSSWAGRSDGLR